MGLNHVKNQDELIKSAIREQHDAVIESDIKKLMDRDGIKPKITQDDASKEATAYITRLLKKRKWTGEEVGKVLIYNLVKNLGRKPTDEEDNNWRAIIAILDKKLQFLTEIDSITYQKYFEISHWLSRAHALAAAHHNSFIVYSTRISEPIMMINNAELISYRITKNSTKPEDPVLCRLLYRLTLNRFTPMDKEKELEIANIKSARSNLLEDFYFTRGYCKVIDLIADYLEINALNIFQIEIKTLYKNILTLNIARKQLASIIEKNNTGVEKAKKLELLNNVFNPIEITWHISGSTIATAQNQLRKEEAFRNDVLYFIKPFIIQDEP
ncbi:hypothetical protein AGMMS49921_09180 [Endomicrobiia bacterium]|nr:hypothetical protein AGMMS49921_09180 [Endomicrobiia bacterium]